MVVCALATKGHSSEHREAKSPPAEENLIQDRKQELEILPCVSTVQTPCRKPRISHISQDQKLPELREIKLMDNEMTRPKHQFSNKLRHGCKKK